MATCLKLTAYATYSGNLTLYDSVLPGEEEQVITQQQPDERLVLEPRDWRVMDQFSPDAVLLVISNMAYDPADYIYQPYSERAKDLKSERAKDCYSVSNFRSFTL